MFNFWLTIPNDTLSQPSVIGSVAASSIATGATGTHQMQSIGTYSTVTPNNPLAQQQQLLDLQQNDEIVINAAMQPMRDPGVLIIAHRSRG
jgi:hypothetical protein